MTGFKKEDHFLLDEQNLFANDVLGRQPHIETLANYIKSTTNPFVLSINAPWGSGKTVFIQLLDAYLKQQGVKTLHINAWETDYLNDPLMTFISSVDHRFNTNRNSSEKSEAFRKAAGKLLITAGLNVGKKLIETAMANVIGVDDINNLVTETLEGDAQGIVDKRLGCYHEAQEAIIEFRSTLEQIVKKEIEGTSFPFIVFVDELDRCRPTYAIEMLESIKHFFNVTNVFFVLGIDRTQLEESIKAVYGAGFNSSIYLTRFIDLDYKLPDASHNGVYYQQFLQNVKDILNDQQKENYLKGFRDLSALMGIDLRMQQQCATHINAVIKSYFSDEQEKKFLVPSLLILQIFLKKKHPGNYKDIFKESYSRDVLKNYQISALHHMVSVLIFNTEKQEFDQNFQEIVRHASTNRQEAYQETLLDTLNLSKKAITSSQHPFTTEFYFFNYYADKIELTASFTPI